MNPILALCGGAMVASSGVALRPSGVASSGVVASPPSGVVGLFPCDNLGLGVRHCDYVFSATPLEEGNEDFSFKLVAARNGDPQAVSLQSTNFPSLFMTLIGPHGRVGLVASSPGNAANATWTLTAGVADATNYSLVSSGGGGLLTRVSANTAPCGYASPAGDIVVAPQAAGAIQTFVVGAPPPPPPPPPAMLVVDARSTDHVIKRSFMGCHSDPGYVQEPLGWSSNLIFGQSFEQGPPRVYAWNPATSATATATVALDPAVSVNPATSAPSLGISFTSGVGVAGWANRGIGNEGLWLLGGRAYEGYALVLAPSGAMLYAGVNDRNAGTVLAAATVPVAASTAWQQVPFSFTPSADTQCDGIAPGSDATIDCGNMAGNPGHVCVRCAGEFVIGLAQPGAAHIGFVALSPGAWGTFAGLPVSARTIATMQEMGIAAIRQGGTVSQSFTWKDWRGVPWLRKSMGHVWGQSLVGAWGLFEFIDMCNAADIEPIVTLAYDTNNAEDWADLVEYLYGDATTTWGAMRINTDAHPATYNIHTFELGNEQENPSFVAQVTAMEARRAAVGAPAIIYMYPTNGGVSDKTAQALVAAGVSPVHIAPDCHVGGGGGVACAEDDWARLPDFAQSAINCETNAAISTLERAIQESSDLQTWFSVAPGVQSRLLARTASFCTERSGHFDGFDQGLSFFLPNASWLQPPGYVHAMITRTWQPNALLVNTTSTDSSWLSSSAQLSDDGKVLVVQLVNAVACASPGAVSVSVLGFTPSSASGGVSVWTLAEPVAAGTIPNKSAGNSPGDPAYVSPQLTTATWGSGAPLTLALPPYSFTIVTVNAA